MMDKQTQVGEQPQTAMQLIGMILKKMPKQLLKTLPLILLLAIFSFLFNFWLMAYINDGFNPDTWLSKNLIPVTGMMFSAVVLWGVVGAIITMFIGFLIRGGNIGKATAGIFKQPGMIIAGIQRGSNRYNAALCFAVAGTLLVGDLLSGISGIMMGILLVTSVGAFITGRGGLLVRFLGMAAKDINGSIFKRSGMKMGDQEVGVIVSSCGISLIIMGLIRAMISLGVIQIMLNAVWMVLFILGLVLFFSNKPVPKAMIFVIVFIGSWLTLNQLGITTVLADDGGRGEIGGTFWDYLNGQGAMEVILRCFPPAIAVMFGSLFGGISGAMAGSLGPISTGNGETTYTHTVDAEMVYGSTDSLDGTPVDDYDKRLLEYINSLDPKGASVMRDPATGTEYLVKYDPVTDTYFELNSKRVFSMDQYEDARRGVGGLEDWRNRNAQLDREYHDKMNQLDDLKARMKSDADKLTDPDERNNLYGQINDINKIQTDFLSGTGELTVPSGYTSPNPVNTPQVPQGGAQGPPPNPEDAATGPTSNMQHLGDRLRDINDYNRGIDGE